MSGGDIFRPEIARARERREAIAGWTRCSWCWNPLPTEPVKRRGLPYCDERCAGRDITVVEDTSAPLSVSDDQLALDVQPSPGAAGPGTEVV